VNYAGGGIEHVNSTGLGNVICKYHMDIFFMYLGLVIYLIIGCRKLLHVEFVISSVCPSILFSVTTFALIDNGMVRFDDKKTFRIVWFYHHFVDTKTAKINVEACMYMHNL